MWKKFSKKNSKFIIHSKPDRNQSKLTVGLDDLIIYIFDLIDLKNLSSSPSNLYLLPSFFPL
jgi:hypothetical protein